nr:hypothetical protein [uncultured Mucilaginibacter sp.]
MKRYLSPLYNLVVFASIIFIVYDRIKSPISSKVDYVLITITAMAAVWLTVKFLLNDKVDLTDLIKAKELDLTEFQKRVNAVIHSNKLDASKIEEIESSVYDKLKGNLTDNLLNLVEDKLKLQFDAAGMSIAIKNEMQAIVSFNSSYINKLQRNSIVNLIIGIAATICAVYVLAIALLNSTGYADLNAFLMHFAPKISFVIFVQIFAFFFLKLYKSNLDDARYFQNEMTNILSKSAALKISQQNGNNNLFEKILLILASTERNFKIAKEETMLDLEKAKMENAQNIDLINSLRDILKSGNK